MSYISGLLSFQVVAPLKGYVLNLRKVAAFEG